MSAPFPDPAKTNQNEPALDRYSAFLVAKYLAAPQDFVNLMKTCKAYRDLSESFRYNPIEMDSKLAEKLFQKIETVHFYSPFFNIAHPLKKYNKAVYWRYRTEGETPIREDESKITLNSLVDDPTRTPPDALLSCVKKVVRIGDQNGVDGSYTCYFTVRREGIEKSIWRERLESAIYPLFGSVVTPINCDLIYKIDISASFIESLPDEAFAYCTRLKELMLPDRLQRVGKRAFYLTSLLEVTINLIQPPS